MILKELSPWGYISGKLGIDSETAKQLFGFDMREGEEYIVFRIRQGKQVLSHYTRPRDARTDVQLKVRGAVCLLSRIVNQGVVKEIWEALSNGTKLNYLSMFVRENLARVIRDGLVGVKLSKGDIMAPRVSSAYYFYNESVVQVRVKLSTLNPRIFILDSSDLILYHSSPNRGGDIKISIPYRFKSPIVYVYYRDGSNFSDSVSIRAIGAVHRGSSLIPSAPFVGGEEKLGIFKKRRQLWQSTMVRPGV